MSRAIWTLIYDLQDEDKPLYLEWFHRVHMTEKLARKGYQWASHYEASCSESDTDKVSRFIAFFGGDSTSTFLNPCPRQLKQTQDAETRSMMGLRSNSMALILNHEWSAENNAIKAQLNTPIISEEITLALLDTPGNNEIAGACCIQEIVAENNSHARISKFSNIIDGMQHGLIFERDDTSIPHPIFRFEGDLGSLIRTPLEQRQMHATLICHGAAS